MVEFPLLCLLCWLTGVYSIFVGCIYVWNIPIVSGWCSMSLFERNHVLRFKWGHDLSQAFFCMIVLIGSFNYLSCWFLQVLVNQYGIKYFTTVCVSTFPAGTCAGKVSTLEGWKVGGEVFNGVSDPMDLRNFFPENLHMKKYPEVFGWVFVIKMMHEHSWMSCSNLATGDMKLKSYEHVTERDPN